MKKLSLNLDDLSVDSFEIDDVEASQGTVQGAAAAESDYCGTTLAVYIWNRTWLQQ